MIRPTTELNSNLTPSSKAVDLALNNSLWKTEQEYRKPERRPPVKNTQDGNVKAVTSKARQRNNTGRTGAYGAATFLPFFGAIAGLRNGSGLVAKGSAQVTNKQHKFAAAHP